MQKKHNLSRTDRVEAGSVSMPVSLATGFFASAIAESKNQFRAPANYELLVNAYYDAPNIQLKTFYCAQMKKIRLQTNSDVEEYLAWFENNLDKLEKKDFGNMKLYEASMNAQIDSLR